jgi:aspartate aminotransferase
LDVKLSHRALGLKPSPTLSVASRAAELKAAGRDIVGLAAGEPDFDTPEFVKKAAIKAIKDGFTKYTPVDGIAPLKQAIIDKFKRENKLDYARDQILVSVGCKHSFYNMAQALLNPDDEVIIPAHYWTSYPDMVKLAGAEPVIIKTSIDKHFKITKDQLRGAITPKTRLLVLNSPSNPTGACYDAEELKALGEILDQHPEIVVVTDDIYEHILWTGEPFVNIVNVCPNLYERTVVLNGVSKSYAMTGWRIGYLHADEGLIPQIAKAHIPFAICAPVVSQHAALAALQGPQDCIAKFRDSYRAARDLMCQRLDRLRRVFDYQRPGGSYLMFPRILVEGGGDSMTFCKKLLREARVSTTPGVDFGPTGEGHLRLSFCVPEEMINRAFDRMEAYFGAG